MAPPRKLHTTQPSDWFKHTDAKGLQSEDGNDEPHAEKARQFRGRGMYTDHSAQGDGYVLEGEDAPGIVAQAYAELERPQSRRGDPTGDLLTNVDYDRYVFVCMCV